MSSFRFLLCPVLSTVPFAEIDLNDVQFTESVDGRGTILTGNAYISNSQTADKLKSVLNYPNDPKAVALYVRYDDQYYWGGVIQSRPWDKDARVFRITATSWKAWLYQRFLPPNVATNPVTDLLYSWTNADQFVIAEGIVNYATAGNGTPTITAGTATSGINRDLNVYGSEFVYAGEAIDRMASREKGFEWDIEIRPDNSGNPNLYFVPYYPKKQGVNSQVLFKSTGYGGNVIEFSSPDDTAENVVTRVWGTGSGTAGTDLLMAYDQDPNLVNETVLLVETKEYTNSSTVEVATVASHAQGIRQFHSSGLQQITVKVPLNDPDFTDYIVGNKVRVLIKDEVLDIDYQSVRIVRRTFNVNASGTNPQEDYLELLIDLNDFDLPQDETAL
jgi:hypothetical protein